MKYCGLAEKHLMHKVAPPRGERGLKSFALATKTPSGRRSPSWGAWIEICARSVMLSAPSGRSPSWGAWIEIAISSSKALNLCGRSPSWGAWIEITCFFRAATSPAVAPPRGERGLKYNIESHHFHHECRSPSWGAWIEIFNINTLNKRNRVAPPRGERGLKYHHQSNYG